MKAIQMILLILIFSCKTSKDASRLDQQQLSPEVNELVNQLIETDFIGTEKIGRSPEPSAAYAEREALLSIATEKELLALIDHPEGEVAATAFEGLMRQNYAGLKTALLDLSKEDRKLSYIKGDVLYTMPALEYAYVNLLGNKLDNEALSAESTEPKKIGLSSAEIAFIENRIMAIRQTL